MTGGKLPQWVRRGLDQEPSGALRRLLFGNNDYIVADQVKVQAVKNSLTDFYMDHADNPAIEYIDNLIFDGVKKDAAIDTITSRIRLDSALLEPQWNHLHDGYLMEELQHFHQLETRGWVGRILDGDEIRLLEDEVERRLLKSGLEIFE